MSDDSKDAINFVTTQIMRGAVGIIAFFLIAYWNDVQEVHQEIKEIKQMSQDILIRQKVTETKLENLEGAVDRNARVLEESNK